MLILIFAVISGLGVALLFWQLTTSDRTTAEKLASTIEDESRVVTAKPEG